MSTPSPEDLYGPRGANQEVHPSFNREPGIAVIPGSPYAKEMARFESQSVGGFPAGNPYKYRPFPKMLYKADRYNGAPACMAAPPDPYAYANPGEFARAEQLAHRFTERCQMTVNDEREYQRAMEGGWRESPAEAVAFLIERDKRDSTADAHREYEDRNMSEAAKREVAAERAARGGDPVPAMPEQPRSRRKAS
jgi:hypothetical protein